MDCPPSGGYCHCRSSSVKLAVSLAWLINAIGYTQCLQTHNVALTGPGCPGVFDRVCTPECQTAVCRALASLYRVTHNPSQPWQHDSGWSSTVSSDCESLTLAGPVYCQWDGVLCCTPNMLHEKHCSAVHSIKALDLQVNGLNGSVDDPEFMNSLLQLHACGTRKLQLQGNDLSGQMSSSAWDKLVNITYLDLGECETIIAGICML